MLMDVCIMYQEDKQYHFAGNNTLGLERYTGEGFLISLRADGSGHAILCSKRETDGRNVQHNVSVGWTEPMTLAQVVRIKPMLEQLQPENVGTVELCVPDHSLPANSPSSKLLAGILEAIFCDRCLLLNRSNVDSEAVYEALSCLPQPCCPVSVGFSLPTGADFCTINLVKLPLVDAFPEKQVLTLDEVSEKHLRLAEIISESDPKLRQYAVEEGSFLIYSALLALHNSKTLKQSHRDALLQGWDIMPAQLQKQILQQLINRQDVPSDQDRKSVLLPRVSPPTVRNLVLLPVAGIWLYLAAQCGILPFTLSFLLLCMYWRGT